MKKKIFAVFLILCLGAIMVVFVRPDIILNPKVLSFVLNKLKIFKSWSWSEAVMDHDWKKWNERRFHGHFKNFCFIYERADVTLDSCLSEVAWDFNLHYNFSRGLFAKTLKPIFIRSSRTAIVLHENTKSHENNKSPPNIYRYWKLLWNKAVPDMDIAFNEILFQKKNFSKNFDISLVKVQKRLEVKSWILDLVADPHGFVLMVPKKYKLPSKFGITEPLYLKDIKLVGEVKRKGIPLQLNGKFDAITVAASSFLDFPLKSNILKALLLKTQANVILSEIKSNLKRVCPKPYNELPAPLNAMNGSIGVKARVVNELGNKVLIQTLTNFNLTSKKQALIMGIRGDLEFDTKTFKPGAITLGFDFDKVALQLPRLEKKTLPPQLYPDSRIKTRAQKLKEKSTNEAEEERSVDIHLFARGDKAVQIMTELLDEPLRLNFDLLVSGPQIEHGTLDVLPLKTKVFKRPVHILNLRFTFNHPDKPVVEGSIVFPLPEYKITLTLKGPINRPSYALTSDPPLSQSDIYSVLLFGRPTSELSPEDTVAAGQTSGLLGQGFLSLSVLYFLAGSPVEYIGFNRDTGAASAQIGLGTRSSVTFQGGRQGWTGTSLRRSLGKGWFLDTSVGNSTEIDSNRESAYGVLIERILAY